jgi:hypothetical protein
VVEVAATAGKGCPTLMMRHRNRLMMNCRNMAWSWVESHELLHHYAYMPQACDLVIVPMDSSRRRSRSSIKRSSGSDHPKVWEKWRMYAQMDGVKKKTALLIASSKLLLELQPPRFPCLVVHVPTVALRTNES